MLNRIYRNIIVLSLFIGHQVFCQMSSGWIDVSGKSPEEVKKITRNAIGEITLKPFELIDAAAKLLEEENDLRIEIFNEEKNNLRSQLNDDIDEKNDLSMSSNDLKSQVAELTSEIQNYQKKISDADSAILNSNELINEEKDRVEDELTKIPFYVVMIGKAEGLTSKDKPVPYEDAISRAMSKRAIEDQIGWNIIKKSVIGPDKTLTEERMNILLKGKTNLNLEKGRKQRIIGTGDESEVVFDLYRYGLVTVYPFQEEEVSLLKSAASKKDVKIEKVERVSKGLAKELSEISPSTKNKITRLNNNSISKNRESESEVKRLNRTAKSIIDQEKNKIKRNQNIIDVNKDNILDDQAGLEGLKAKLTQTSFDLDKSTNVFNLSKNNYNGHIASEEYTRVFRAVGSPSAIQTVDEKLAELAVDTYEDFITSIKSEYLKETTDVINGSLSEIKESKKSDIKLNEIKILGKVSETDKYGDTKVSSHVVYKFGFTFEDVPNIAVSGLTLDDIVTNMEEPVKAVVKKAKKAIKAYNIKITSNPNADVYVAGQKIGKTPLQYYLDPSSPHGIVLKKKGYQDETDVVSVSAGRLVTKNYNLDKVKVEKVAKKSGGRKWLLYAIVGGGVAYAAMGQKKEGPKTGSLSLTISIPN